ncbi:hypothetical protein CLOM_g20431 [Closterium sp. NIES-68]|nr:hypothetical protein CLOM_g20431 [Closterium sp. NIES-68]GJP85493.1 hypothetical protein CLOP_g15586 [Closterium sp. NIES-67]
MLEYLRHLVSMKRRRYIRDGYDLDLSYITERVVAMSYPAESLEAMFRNPMWQVQRFLAANHAHHFKVYNLCSEQWYDPAVFGGRVERFPFDDHGVPALELVMALCESAQDWLDRSDDNIIVVHCKAGKGRTGVMVCCLLLLAGMTTDDALALYAQRRTLNNAGVTIPSQVRYVRYWARLIADAQRNAAPITLPPPTPRTVRRIRLYGMTGLDRVDFVICTLDEADKERYSAPVERCKGTCEKAHMGVVASTATTFVHWLITRPALRKTLALDRNNLLPVSPADAAPPAAPRATPAAAPSAAAAPPAPPAAAPAAAVAVEAKGGEVVRAGEVRRASMAQLDTERPSDPHHPPLQHFFDPPFTVEGDVSMRFTDSMGSRLFAVCFNTAFTKGLLSLSLGEVDKPSGRLLRACDSSFCMEVLFAPDCPSSSSSSPAAARPCLTQAGS